MATTSDIKNGKCLEMKQGIWQITEFQHVKPGKGAAFVRTKLKNLATGKVVDNTFPAGHKITFVRIERRSYQFLYKNDMGMNFMNNETYDQISLDEKLLTNPQLLKEGENVEILFHAEKELPLTCDLPQYVVLKVESTEPGIKGDTATNATKPATMETGAVVNVPLFVSEGELIKIDTKTCSYMERAKK